MARRHWLYEGEQLAHPSSVLDPIGISAKHWVGNIVEPTVKRLRDGFEVEYGKIGDYVTEDLIRDGKNWARHSEAS